MGFACYDRHFYWSFNEKMSKGKKNVLDVIWKIRLKQPPVHWCLLLLHFDGTGGGSKGDPFMLIDIFIGFPIYRVVALQHGKQANASPFFPAVGYQLKVSIQLK